MDNAELWAKHYQAFVNTLPVGESALEKGTAYVYRVASIYMEAGFSLYLIKTGDQEWITLVKRALELFARSVREQDCESRDQYPFNLARLYLEWYLSTWWLGELPAPHYLEKTIALNLEGLQQRKVRNTGLYLPLAQCLLVRDGRIGDDFWQNAESVAGPLTRELVLLRRISALADQPQPDFSAFLESYQMFFRRLRSPAEQPANFYLTLAYFVSARFPGVSPMDSTLRQLAIG